MTGRKRTVLLLSTQDPPGGVDAARVSLAYPEGCGGARYQAARALQRETTATGDLPHRGRATRLQCGRDGRARGSPSARSRSYARKATRVEQSPALLRLLTVRRDLAP